MCARRSGTLVVLVGMVLLVSWMGTIGCPSVIAQETGVAEVEQEQAAAATGASTEGTAASSEGVPAPGSTAERVETYINSGVDLYLADRYGEALEQFNRAVSLDPTSEKAQDFIARCQQKLAAATREEIDVLYPSEVPPPPPPGAEAISPEEIEKRRIQELINEGNDFAEVSDYEKAIAAWEQILLIDPNHEEARKLILDTSYKVIARETKQTREDVETQTSRLFYQADQKKLMPEGANVDGIIPFRPQAPILEKPPAPPTRQQEIERLLETPVDLNFGEGIDLRDIITFLEETVEINIVLDERVVLPPTPTVAPGAEGMPGMGPYSQYPGMTGYPGGGYPGGGLGGGRGERGLSGLGGLSGIGGLGGLGGQGGVGPITATIPTQIRSIMLTDIPLKDALKAVLYQIGLDYSIEPNFIWISRPDILRTETFEELETRYYILQNAGTESLPKIVVRTPGGPSGGGGMGGMGGGMGGMGGGMGGGGGAATFMNISELFGSISHYLVGEPEPVIYISGTGTYGAGGGGTAGLGAGGVGGGAGLGGIGAGGAGGGMGGISGGTGGFNEIALITILRNLIPEIIEPNTGNVLSSITFIPTTNQLVVRNSPTNLALLETQLKTLDLTPKQLSIESKFITIATSDLEKMGFDYGESKVSDLNNRPRVYGAGSTPYPASPGQIPPSPLTRGIDVDGDGDIDEIDSWMQTDGSRILGSSVTAAEMASADALLRSLGSNFEIVGSIIKQEDGDTLNFIFQALSSLQHTEILSAPRVTTLNRKPAVVASIKTEYFPASVYTNAYPISAGGFGAVSTVVTTNVIPQAFIFGITLSVTPQIGKGNMIRLWLNPQIVDFLGEKVFFQRQAGPDFDITSEMRLPTTQVQAVWTNVYVNDGDTLVLGGLVRDKTESFEERLPWISRVPVLGFFFRGEGKRVSQDNLLIFVTVNLIDSTGAKWAGPLEEEGFSTY